MSKIDDDHLYHGAALVQIAEDPQFTAINAQHANGAALRGAYRVNDDIGIYLKYAVARDKAHGEYQFGFSEKNIADVKKVSALNEKTYVVLVCVKARAICCIPFQQFLELLERRKNANGGSETGYTILVTAEPNKMMQVYVNAPARKNTMLGAPIKVARSAFPSVVFN